MSSSKWQGHGALSQHMALLLLFLLPSAFALAQTAPAVRSSHRANQSRVQASIDFHVGQLAQALDLTEPQQSAVRKILEQRQVQVWSLRRDPSISGSARVDRFRSIQEHTVEQIRAVLSEDQKQKYDPLAVRKLQPASDQSSVEDWLKATTQH